MKHLFVTLILLIGLCSGLSRAKPTFQQTICGIVRAANAQVNIVYRFPSETEVLAAPSPNLFEHEYENWNEFYYCLVQKPVVIRNLEQMAIRVEPLRSSSSINIYFINSCRSMLEVLEFLNPKQHMKHTHRYVFIWLLKDFSALRIFFKRVWQKNILHAVAAVMNLQQIYTFEPFTPQGFRLRLLAEQIYFYDKLSNFYHSELRIAMFNDGVRAIPLRDPARNGYRKIDGRVAGTLVQFLNATPLYITPNDNQTYGSLINGSFSGSLKDIHSGHAHVGLNFRFILDDVKPHFEELYPYKKRLLYLVVPAAVMRPSYLIFARAFTYSLWRLLLLNFFLMLLTFVMLLKLVERLPNYRQQNCQTHWRWYEIMEIFSKTHLGQPVMEFSCRSSLRQFLITWILFSYLITTIYFAKLESSFVQPLYEPELDNLQDLHKLKVPIYASDVIFQAVKVSLEPTFYNAIDKNAIRIAFNSIADDLTLTQAKKLKNVAMILNNDMAKEVLAQTYSDETERPTLHIVREYLRSLPCTYVVTKGSPFIYKFRKIISSFIEHGFVKYWLEADSQQNRFLHRSEEYQEDLEDDFSCNGHNEGISTCAILPAKKKKVLNLEILEGAFYLWLAGICFSCFGFCAELVYGWYERRRMNILIV